MTIVLSSYRARMEATERDLAAEALKVERGCIESAAKAMGLHHFQLRRIIVRHNLQVLVRSMRGVKGNAAWRMLEDA